jgi:hypothetical protein
VAFGHLSSVIAVFEIVLIGHAPKWPIYVTILSWMGLFLPGEPRVRMSFGSSLVPKRAS